MASVRGCALREWRLAVQKSPDASPADLAVELYPAELSTEVLGSLLEDDQTLPVW